MNSTASSGPARSLKQRHNEVTRRAILEAARRAFAETGFAGTSIRSVSESAGVAVQTIYSTFGSKGGILVGLIDLLDQEAGVLELAARIRETADPREALGLYARIRRQIRERSGDIVRILRSGAVVDDQVAAVLAEGMRRRAGGLVRVMERVEQSGVLKPGLTAQRAADTAAALIVDEICDVLVEQRGWSFDQYEAWLRETLITLLLQSERQNR